MALQIWGISKTRIVERSLSFYWICIIALLCSGLLLLPKVVTACERAPNNQEPTLRIPSRHFQNNNRYSHTLDLLQLALNKTLDEYGPCHITEVEHSRPTNRVLLQLSDSSQFDVVRAAVSPERDENLRPITFPVYRGLMGYRVLVINPHTHPDFSKVKTKSDLKKFSYGVGSNWTDAKILAKNGLETVGAYDIVSLYKMLEINRFDGILRGSHEVISDQLRLAPTNIQIEQHLVIAYPLPVNFYVKKSNTLLAERLNTGLEKAQQDGSMEKFFNESRLVKDTLKELSLINRRFIYFCNHTLTRDAKINNDAYWLKPWPASIKSCQNSVVNQHNTRDNAKTVSAIQQSL